MRKNLLLFVLVSAMFFSSCTGTGEQGFPSSSTDIKQDSFQQMLICELDKSDVGNAVSASGKIGFVTDDDPEGIFAEVKDEGCMVGIFAPTEILEIWKASQKNVMQMGNHVTVWGKLVSFNGQLIIDLADIKEVQQNSIDDTKQEDLSIQATFDLPDALPTVMLDVPLIYSGYNKMPGLCYLGSAGMLVRYAHPEIDFSDVVAFSGVGSSALHLDFPEMPSALISPYMDQSIVFMANNLGMPFVLGFQSGGVGSDNFQPAALPFEENSSNLLQVADKAQAEKTLKQALSAGYPVLVYLNMYPVHDNFSEDSLFWRDVLGKDQASHYMVVKGYDAQSVYLNDPTDPTDAAGDLSASWDNFLDAWEDTTNIINAPPLGPFWSLFFTEKGEIPPIMDVISLNLEKAIKAPSEIRSFAKKPDDDPFSLFLLLELANARIQYGNYLSQNKYPEAGSLYIQSGRLLETMVIDGSVNTDSLLLAADFEEQALKILME